MHLEIRKDWKRSIILPSEYFQFGNDVAHDSRSIIWAQCP